MKSEYTILIGEKLKNIRQEKQMTLRELSDKASAYYGKKISHTSLMYYENNGRSMDIDVLLSICKALDIDMGKFLDEIFDEVNKSKKKKK